MKALLVLLTIPVLCAQETRLGSETAEVLGGVIYKHGDGRAETAVGGRILGGINRYLSAYGEYAFSRVISETTYTPRENKVRASYMDFGGGGELHWSGHRLQPYALGGVGSVRISAKAIVGPAEATVSNYHFASSAGGGLRIFATRGVGFLVEAKSVHIPSISGRFERYAVGMFYQRQREKSEPW